MKLWKNKTGWPLNFGILYVMANFPWILFTKEGITGGNVFDRAKQVDKDAPGIPIPIMAIVTPFAYEIEQVIHAITKPLYIPFYKGDGSTEWRVLVGYLIAYLMLKYYWFGLIPYLINLI